MSDESIDHAVIYGPRVRRRVAASTVSILGMGLDVLTILSLALAVGSAYHFLLFSGAGPLEKHVAVGLVAGLFYSLLTAIRDGYGVNAAISPFRPMAVLATWTCAFGAVLATGFILKVSDSYSRGSLLLLYLAGIPLLLLVRLLYGRAVAAAAEVGAIAGKRIFIIGSQEAIQAFTKRYRPHSLGLRLVGTAALPASGLRGSSPPSPADLQQAMAKARAVDPDAVVIAAPWFNEEVLDACLEGLQSIPAEIHLGPERLLERFHTVKVSRVGPLVTLQLTTRPLDGLNRLLKRIFDVVLSLVALVLLMPVFLLVALAIKLDSPGPVFFFQQRNGFNEKTFRIIKFRTMTVLEESGDVRQATRDDPRITRIGRWLRRSNLDELPQLLNVLRGEMSLVGPRPHAVAHNRAYERRIALYARRHNVKPGMTGWAQVNGFRGETREDETMLRRVECDLYYIDNWSLLLDVQILLLTVLSPRIYRNAF